MTAADNRPESPELSVPLHRSLAALSETVARDIRLAQQSRQEVGRKLLAEDLRSAADADPRLRAQLSRAQTKLEEDAKAAEEWREALERAVKDWRAVLDSAEALRS
jgi:hypothetical protein